MSKIKYEASFSYADANTSGGKVSNGGNVPLLSFTVLGSPTRTIDFTSKDEMDIASVMKQIERDKAIYIYVPATRGLEIVDFNSYSDTPDALLKVSLMVTILSGGIQTKSLKLESQTASIGKFFTANKANNSVAVNVYFKEAKLHYTSHTVKVLSQRARVIYSQWKEF
jgi:hypothetical protein